MRKIGYVSASWLLPICFFLATAADASCNAFLPIFARALQPATPALSPNMAAGLPIAAFWLMVAAAQLSTALWERGRDHRWLITAALALSALALALSSQADSVPELVLWRAMGGLATGMVMILAQDGMLRGSGAQARTTASGGYLAAFFAGTIAGTLGGGFIAGRGGADMAFLTAAALAVTAMLVAWRLPSHRDVLAPQPFRVTALLRNPSLMALVLLAAVPSRLLISAFLYYLAPLRLHDQGVSTAETGWILALYAAIMATTTPLWSRMIDRSGRPFAFTLGGLGLSALAMAVVPLASLAGWHGPATIIAAIVLLGLAQAIGMAPQVTVLFNVAAAEMDRFGRTPVLGVFRVFERLGLFAGPLLAGFLGNGTDQSAFTALALLAALAVPALGAAFAFTGRVPAGRLNVTPETMP